MRRCVVVAVILFFAAGLAAAGSTATYGKGVTLEDSVAIAELLESPGDYVDSMVRVEGTITGVCKKRGCWMQISDAEGNGIRVKVEDGVMVFPYTAMGHHAVAEGVFTAIPVKSGHHHHAAEGSGDCDDGEKKAAGGDHSCAGEAHGEFVYQIQGTGAQIDA